LGTPKPAHNLVSLATALLDVCRTANLDHAKTEVASMLGISELDADRWNLLLAKIQEKFPDIYNR
jgi:hypothetical protein